MKRMQILLLVLGLVIVALFVPQLTLAEEDEYGGEEEDGGSGDGYVIVLTDSNFDDIIKASKFALVEFYAPWCGHCKQLAPHYAKAASKLKTSLPEVVIAKVDATVETEIARKFGVSGYPTLKWFTDGDTSSPVEYNGGRDEKGIVNWITKKSGPATTIADTPEALYSHEAMEPLIVLGYFSATEGPEFESFLATARKAEDAKFLVTSSAEVADLAGLSSAPSVTLIKNFKGEPREVIPLATDITERALNKLIADEKLPLSVEFNGDNSDRIFKSGVSKQVILWTTAADLEPTASVITTYKKVSAKFKGRLVFVTSNNEGTDHEPLTNFFALKDRPSPVVLGFEMTKNKKYRMEEEFNEANLEAFATAVLLGTAQADFKSAPIPEGDAATDGGVVVVVGKTVDTIVKDEKKDVLLEVYAPWCGHCKQLDPIYKKLAKRFKKIDSIVIAKMDGTENEHSDIEVKGYPTLIFFPAGKDAQPMPFEGDRTLKGMTKFLKTYAKIPFELPRKDRGSKSEADMDTDDAKDEL